MGLHELSFHGNLHLLLTLTLLNPLAFTLFPFIHIVIESRSLTRASVPLRHVQSLTSIWTYNYYFVTQLRTHTHTHADHLLLLLMSKSLSRLWWGQRQSKIKLPISSFCLGSPGSIRMYQPFRICWPLPAYSATCCSATFIVLRTGQGLAKC